jgi:PBSX family phage portal protein
MAEVRTPADGPPPEKVEKAIRAARADENGETRVLKVLYLDEQGESVGEWASTQMPSDPFLGQRLAGVMEPPFPMEQLVYLAEMHPVHSAALEQKTADICGKGWQWEAEDPDAADEDKRDELSDWFESLSPDEQDMREVISAVWLDVETTGWGLFECVREAGKPDGEVKRIYQVPAHTVRVHKNGFALVQIRDSRRVWFRRWGAQDIAGKRIDVDIKTGSLKTVNKPANDLFVIRRPCRRSSWYGIPGYVSAIGWITLALAVRDDNLFFFANRREPRWAIILTGVEGQDDDIQEDLRRAFTVDLKTPYRNLIIPVKGDKAKVDFQKLSDTKTDGSFEKLGDRADKAVMIAHRVPAERLANSEVGNLGGNIASEANRVYKEGVVGPSQELLNSRLNRFIAVERGIVSGKENADGDKNPWQISMDDLDIRSDREDLDQAIMAWHADIITLRETRHRLKLGPLMVPKPPEPVEPEIDPLTGQPIPPDPLAIPPEPPEPELDDLGNVIAPEEIESPYNDKLFTELPGVAAGQAGAPGGPPPSGAGRLTPDTLSKTRLSAMEQNVRDLLRQSRDTHERLSELTDE